MYNYAWSFVDIRYKREVAIVIGILLLIFKMVSFLANRPGYQNDNHYFSISG